MRLREFPVLQRDEVPSGPVLRALNRQNERNLLEQQATKLEKKSSAAQANHRLRNSYCKTPLNTSKHGIYDNPQCFVVPKITGKKKKHPGALLVSIHDETKLKL